MADLITIGQLSALVEDQYRLLGWYEDHGSELPAFDPHFPEHNEAEVEIEGEAWRVTVVRSGWEFRHRSACRTVLLHHGHPSPLDFHPLTLLRFVQSLDAACTITDIVVDNWLVKFVRAGRLACSKHKPGYYTFG